MISLPVDESPTENYENMKIIPYLSFFNFGSYIYFSHFLYVYMYI